MLLSLLSRRRSRYTSLLGCALGLALLVASVGCQNQETPVNEPGLVSGEFIEAKPPLIASVARSELRQMRYLLFDAPKPETPGAVNVAALKTDSQGKVFVEIEPTKDGKASVVQVRMRPDHDDQVADAILRRIRERSVTERAQAEAEAAKKRNKQRRKEAE